MMNRPYITEQRGH